LDIGNIDYPWREESRPLVSRSWIGGEVFAPDILA
jgi:hypothetical protein